LKAESCDGDGGDGDDEDDDDDDDDDDDMIMNSEYMLQVLHNLTCFFDHLGSTQYHRSVLITVSVTSMLKQFVL
jgi:hypothetical protein